MDDEEDDHIPTEEDQANLTPIFQSADKYGNILWYNEDGYLRTEERHHEQVSAMRNVERLLENGGMEEALPYLNDLNVFPHFIWGKARYELARLWSSPEIIAVPDEEIDPEDEDEEGEDENVKMASAFDDLNADDEDRDADWTDDEDQGGVIDDDDRMPEQEEATEETTNFVDTVLDVYEDALHVLKEKDAEIEASVGHCDTFDMAHIKEAAHLRAVRFHISSLERRCESTLGIVLLLHSLGMPYYTILHTERALEMANHAASLQEELDVKSEKEAIIKAEKDREKKVAKQKEEEELNRIISQSQSQYFDDEGDDGNGNAGENQKIKEAASKEEGSDKNSEVNKNKDQEEKSNSEEKGQSYSSDHDQRKEDSTDFEKEDKEKGEINEDLKVSDDKVSEDDHGTQIQEKEEKEILVKEAGSPLPILSVSGDTMVPFVREGNTKRGSMSSALFQNVDNEEGVEEQVIEEVGKDDHSIKETIETALDIASDSLMKNGGGGSKKDINTHDVKSETDKEGSDEENGDDDEGEDSEEDSVDRRHREAAEAKARYENIAREKLAKRPKNPLRPFQLKCMTILAKLKQDQNMLTSAEEMYRRLLLEGVSVGTNESRFSLLESVGEFTVDGESDEEGGDEDDRLAEIAQKDKEMIDAYHLARDAAYEECPLSEGWDEYWDTATGSFYYAHWDGNTTWERDEVLDYTTLHQLLAKLPPLPEGYNPDEASTVVSGLDQSEKTSKPKLSKNKKKGAAASVSLNGDDDVNSLKSDNKSQVSFRLDHEEASGSGGDAGSSSSSSSVASTGNESLDTLKETGAGKAISSCPAVVTSASAAESEDESDSSDSDSDSDEETVEVDMDSCSAIELSIEVANLRLKQGRYRDCRRVVNMISTNLDLAMSKYNDELSTVKEEASARRLKRERKEKEKARLDAQAAGGNGSDDSEDDSDESDDDDDEGGNGKERGTSLKRDEPEQWMKCRWRLNSLRARLALADCKLGRAKSWCEPLYQELRRRDEDIFNKIEAENKKARELEEQEAELRRNGLQEEEEEEEEPDPYKDATGDDEQGDENPNIGPKLARELVEGRKKAAVAGGEDHWLIAETMADISENEGHLRRAAQYLELAFNGFKHSCLWWHENTIRCFAKHQKILGRIADIERRDKLRELESEMARQREEGAWVAAKETEKVFTEVENSSGASQVAEEIFQKIEALKKAVGPGHVNVGRLQMLLADTVQMFPQSTWVRKKKGSTLVLDTIKADKLYAKAAKLLGVSLGDDHPEAITARAHQAFVLAKFLHRRNEADPILLEELKNADDVMGVSSPLSLKLLETIVESRLEWARDDAHRWLAEARHKSRNLYARLGNGRGAKHPATLTALSMLADITAMPNTKRAIGSAVRLYKRCIGLRKRVLGNVHIDTVGSICSLIDLLVKADTEHSLQTAQATAHDIYEECKEKLLDKHSLSTVMAQRSLAIASEGFWRAASLRLAEREAARRGKPGNLQSKRRLMKKMAAQWFTISIEHCFTAWRKYTSGKKRPVISRETKANEREFRLGMQEDLSLTISRGNTPSTAGSNISTSTNNMSPVASRAQTPSSSKFLQEDTIVEEDDASTSSSMNTSSNNNTSHIITSDKCKTIDGEMDEKNEIACDNDADDEGDRNTTKRGKDSKQELTVLASSVISSSRKSSNAASRRSSTASKDIYRIPTALMGVFSSNEIMKFREQFEMFDADGSGAIDEYELRDVLNKLDTKISEEELQAMIAEVDENGDGEIDFQEFLFMMHIEKEKSKQSGGTYDGSFSHFIEVVEQATKRSKYAEFFKKGSKGSIGGGGMINDPEQAALHRQKALLQVRTMKAMASMRRSASFKEPDSAKSNISSDLEPMSPLSAHISPLISNRKKLSLRANSVELSNMVSGMIADKKPLKRMSSMKRSESFNYDEEPFTPLTGNSNSSEKERGRGGMFRSSSFRNDEPFSPVTFGTKTPRSRRSSSVKEIGAGGEDVSPLPLPRSRRSSSVKEIGAGGEDVSPLPLPRSRRSSSVKEIGAGGEDVSPLPLPRSRRNSSIKSSGISGGDYGGNNGGDDSDEHSSDAEGVSPLPRLPRSRRNSSRRSSQNSMLLGERPSVLLQEEKEDEERKKLELASQALLHGKGSDQTDKDEDKDDESSEATTGGKGNINNALVRIVRAGSPSASTRLSVMLSRSLSMNQKRTMGRSMGRAFVEDSKEENAPLVVVREGDHEGDENSQRSEFTDDLLHHNDDELSYPESMLGKDSSSDSEWDLEEAGFEGLSPEAKAAMKKAAELWSLNSEGFKNSDTDGDELRRQENLKLSRIARFRLGGVQKDGAMLAEAEITYRKLYVECRDELGIDHGDTLEALTALSDVIDAQGQEALGRSSIDERRLLLEGLLLAFYPAHPRVLRAQLALGRILARFTGCGGEVQGGHTGMPQGLIGLDEGGEGSAPDRDLDEAVDLFMSAMQAAQESLGETSDEAVEAVDLLCHALRLRCNPTEIVWRRDFLTACEKQTDPLNPDADPRETAAAAAFEEGDEKDVSNVAVQILRNGAWNNMNTISAAQRLAGALENRAFNHPKVLIDEEEDLLDEATALRLRVVERLSLLMGEVHEDTAFAHVAVARLLIKRRNHNQAEAKARAEAAAHHYSTALHSLRLNRFVGVGNIKTLIVTKELTHVLVEKLQDYKTAEPLLRRVIKNFTVMCVEVFAVDSMKLLGKCLKATNRMLEAHSLYRRCVELHHIHTGANLPLTLDALEDLAITTEEITVATEDPLEVLQAIRLWRDLWHGRTLAQTSTHPDTCRAEISLGCSLLECARLAEAKRKGRGGSIPSPRHGDTEAEAAAAERKKKLFTCVEWGHMIDEAEQFHRHAAESLETRLGAADPDTVSAFERLIKTILIRLTDWKENFPMIPRDLRPTTRVVDDLRSEAEALCIRVVGARTHLHGHGSKRVVEAEHLLSQVLLKAVPREKPPTDSIFRPAPKPTGSKAFKIAREIEEVLKGAESFKPPPPLPGLNPWKDKKNELVGALQSLDRRQLLLHEWQRPPNPIPAAGVHSVEYAPAVYNPDDHQLRPWKKNVPIGLEFSDAHGDHIAYKVVHRRAI